MKNRRLKKKCTVMLTAICLCLGVGTINVLADPTESGTPVIHIETEKKNGNALEKEDGYVKMHVTIMDEDGNIVLDETEGQVKVRGNSTAHAWKKPYTVKLDQKTDIFGMGEAKKWNILANCFDPTQLRNTLALELAKKMGLEFTGEQQVTELILDGRLKGMYLWTEPVEVGEHRVDINTDQGDYLVELEEEREEEGVIYLNVGGRIRFALSDPEDAGAEQLEKIQKSLDEHLQAVQSRSYFAVTRSIDVVSFAKYFILNELFKNVDFGFSSTYFYEKSGKLYAGPAWDFDISAGNENAEYAVSYGEAMDTKELYMVNNWYEELWKYPEFQALTARIYQEYTPVIEVLYQEGGTIDQLTEKYDKAISRNFGEAGWKPSTVHIVTQRVPDESYEENVEFLKNWLKERHEWLSESWKTDTNKDR